MPLYTVENTRGMVVDIFLDDAPVTEVIEADTDQGYLEKFVIDHKGHPVIKDGCFVTERLTGKVRVEATPRSLRQGAPVDAVDL